MTGEIVLNLGDKYVFDSMVSGAKPHFFEIVELGVIIGVICKGKCIDNPEKTRRMSINIFMTWANEVGAVKIDNEGELPLSLVFSYYPEKNKIRVVDSNLTPLQLVNEINNKKTKVLGDYLQDSKQTALIKDGEIIITIE